MLYVLFGVDGMGLHMLKIPILFDSQEKAFEYAKENNGDVHPYVKVAAIPVFDLLESKKSEEEE